MAVETSPHHEWHSQEIDVVLARLNAATTGLTAADARERLARVGPNELQVLSRSSAWHTLAAQFKNVLVIILLVATALSGLLGHGLEAIVIAVIVLFAVLLGFVQEHRAERALEALRQMAAPVAHAIRDGVPIDGVCLFPVIDRPDWEDANHWHNSGLWDMERCGDRLERVLNEPYAMALRAAQSRVQAALDARSSPARLAETITETDG